ncbi:hypothetical protein [Burkholderia ambifaria]|uniref:hypothetical protein n=1 Tax=Burkholderia ambifaria TaxID=152480 RepID=UPI00158E603A|nr:hypothetical protein [Burkholderia ambifaria]
MLDIVFLGAESARMRADRRDLPLCCAAAGFARILRESGVICACAAAPRFFIFVGAN